MSPILIAPPAGEPVSLPEAKLYLRIDASDEDDLVRALITASRLLIEAASGRLLINQTWRLILDAWPAGGTLRLPLSPAGQIAGARVFDANGAPTAVSPSALVLEAGSDPPLLLVQGAAPSPGRARAGVEIDVVAGFGPSGASVPEPIRQAMLRMIALWFENRGDAMAAGPSLPAPVMALVAPYRRPRL
jgi:uncharacterized phiE125 gp8 family phage protein